tara:strand:- start:480 stop:605 length:126 start_codon:yes stop_codon:yes gene_type:complete
MSGIHRGFKPTPIIKKKTGLNFFNYSSYDLTRLKSNLKTDT